MTARHQAASSARARRRRLEGVERSDPAVRTAGKAQTPKAQTPPSKVRPEGIRFESHEVLAIAQVAHEQLASGCLETAVSLFEGLTVLQPRHPEYWLGLAVSLDGLGQGQLSEQATLRGMKLAPKDGRFYLKYAEHLLSRSDHPKAHQSLQRALSLGLGQKILKDQAEAMLGLVEFKTHHRGLRTNPC